MKSIKTSIHITLYLMFTCLSVPTLGSVYCNEQGVRLEVLGSGELSFDTTRAAGSYLVWHNDKARVLINAGAGTYSRYKFSGADFSDLMAIVTTQTGIEQTADLPSMLMASLRSGRTEPLPIYGPSGNDTYPSISQLFERLVSEEGAYPELSSFLSHSNPAGYRVRIREVHPPARKHWGGFANAELRLSAIVVQSGSIPSLAWRINIGETAIVFAGEFSNQRDIVAEFAKGANALVVSHRLPSGARGLPLDFYVTPEEIGRIAAKAEVKHVLLGSRGWRTFGRENATQETIAAAFTGPQLYANEEECWGF